MAEKEKKGLNLDIKALTKPKKAKPIATEKRTMNFAQRESNFNIKKLIPVLAIIAVALGVFAKFGILDQLAKKSDAYNTLAQKQEQQEELNNQLASYSDLEENYGKYSYGWMTENEVNAVDRMQVLTLIEEKVMPQAAISDFSVSNNVLTLNLSGITLDQTSGIVKDLESDPLVKKVSVYSATAPDAEIAKVFMSIMLQNPEEETTKEATP